MKPEQFRYDSSVENLLLQQEQQIDYNGSQSEAAAASFPYENRMKNFMK